MTWEEFKDRVDEYIDDETEVNSVYIHQENGRLVNFYESAHGWNVIENDIDKEDEDE